MKRKIQNCQPDVKYSSNLSPVMLPSSLTATALTKPSTAMSRLSDLIVARIDCRWALTIDTWTWTHIPFYWPFSTRVSPLDNQQNTLGFTFFASIITSKRERASLNSTLAVAQCIVIGLACGFVAVCLFVCGSVTTITRNCVHRSSPNWVCR